MKKWIYNIIPFILLSMLVYLAIFLPRKVSDYFDSLMFDKLYTQTIPKTSLLNYDVSLSITDKINLIRQYGHNTSISRSHSGTYVNYNVIEVTDSSDSQTSKKPSGNIIYRYSDTLYDQLLEEALDKFNNFLTDKNYKYLDNINDELILKVKNEINTLIDYQIMPPIYNPDELQLYKINCITYTNINNMDEYVSICYFKFNTKYISIDLLYDLDSNQIYQYTMSGIIDTRNINVDYIEQGIDDDSFPQNMKKGLCNYLQLDTKTVESYYNFNSYTNISDIGNLYGTFDMLLSELG